MVLIDSIGLNYNQGYNMNTKAKIAKCREKAGEKRQKKSVLFQLSPLKRYIAILFCFDGGHVTENLALTRFAAKNVLLLPRFKRKSTKSFP